MSLVSQFNRIQNNNSNRWAPSTVRQYGYGILTDILCTERVPLLMRAQNSHVLWYRNQKQVHHIIIYCLFNSPWHLPQGCPGCSLFTAAVWKLCRREQKKLWAEHVLIFKQYLSSVSHSPLHEAVRNEVPGKTKQQKTTDSNDKWDPPHQWQNTKA